MMPLKCVSALAQSAGIQVQGSRPWSLRERATLHITFETLPSPPLRGVQYQGGGPIGDVSNC